MEEESPSKGVPLRDGKSRRQGRRKKSKTIQGLEEHTDLGLRITPLKGFRLVWIRFIFFNKINSINVWS